MLDTRAFLWMLQALEKLALSITIDELFGVATVKPRNGRTPDTRLQRRLQQIERMPARNKRQVLQVLDAFIERAQLKADA